MSTVTIGTSDLGDVTVDPARLISTRMLIQANSGGGKSWMLRVLCERLGKSTPLIVLDWEGEFASLREKLDVLLVGRDGEVPTAVPTAGALATQIIEMGVSAVVDLYDLNPHDKRMYVRRFLESLMAAPKRLWRPYFVIVDEAHSLVPEAGQAESADAVNALMSQGRKRQFCGILATQRLSKLHKDAAAEANNVLIGRCNLDLDQKRAGDVLGMGKAEYTQLRTLTEGQFYGFGPALNFDGVRMFRGAEVQTTHGTKAMRGFKPPEPSARMQAVVGQLKDLAERAKTEVLDLDAARTTIKDLRRQLASASKAAPVVVADDRAVAKAVAERDRFWNGEIGKLNKAVALATGRLGQIAKLAHLNGDMPTLAKPPEIVTTSPKLQPAKVEWKRPAQTHSQATDVALPGPHRRILESAAYWRSIGVDRPTVQQLAAGASYAASGSFDTYLSRMGTDGLLVRSQGMVELTEAGWALAPDVDAPVHLDDHLDRVRAILDGPQTRIINALIRVGPSTVADLAAACDPPYAASGSFDTYLSRLGTKGLIVRKNGVVTPTAVLIPESLAQ